MFPQRHSSRGWQQNKKEISQEETFVTVTAWDNWRRGKERERESFVISVTVEFRNRGMRFKYPFISRGLFVFQQFTWEKVWVNQIVAVIWTNTKIWSGLSELTCVSITFLVFPFRHSFDNRTDRLIELPLKNVVSEKLEARLAFYYFRVRASNSILIACTE